MELSLEENRAQRGSVGYVDMGRVFKLNPETFRAKESFEDAVRQAEEGVNIRKAEVLRLRNELASLKTEREVLAKAATDAAAAKAATDAAAAKAAADAAAAKAAADAAAAKAAAVAATAKAAPAPSASTQTVPIALPAALSTSPVGLPGAPDPVVAQPLPEPPASTAPPAPQVKVPTVQETALADLDAKIERKTGELTQKESEFKNLQAMAEKNLLDLESRKTEILLGKIHKAIMDIARKEGISVVVDKNSILYGHEAVDLTEKVLQALRGGG